MVKAWLNAMTSYCESEDIVQEKFLADSVAARREYLRALNELKLPFHKPKSVEQYGPEFWDSKSKKPYRWTGKKEPGCVPWVQFVGYQVRYDGLVRIKKASVQKHLDKLVETTGL